MIQTELFMKEVSSLKVVIIYKLQLMIVASILFQVCLFFTKLFLFFFFKYNLLFFVAFLIFIMC